MRAVHKGALSFGLVNVPVKLMKATESHDIGFHQHHAECNGGISLVRECKECGERVAYGDIVKGIEVNDKLVTVTTDELKELEDEAGTAIEVLAFVAATDVDPIMYDEASYYLEPDKSLEGYALLRRVLRDTGKVGDVKWTSRGKTHRGVLRVVGNALVIHQLLWADEVRNASQLKDVDKEIELNPKLVQMAHALVESMAGDFDPEAVTDSYTERVDELVQAKAAGTKLTIVKSEPKEEVSDLLAALEASIKTA